MRKLSILLLLALSACGVQPALQPTRTITPLPTSTLTLTLTPTPVSTTEPGSPPQLRIGQSATVDQLTLTLNGISNDSRCPTQVNCVWQGSAEVRVGIVVDGREQGSYTLTLNGRNRETDTSRVQVEGYTVRFTGLDPYPQTPEPIPASDYVAYFIVEQAGQVEQRYTPVSGDSFEGVIVPEQDAAAFGLNAESYWTPGEPEVRALEAGLAAFLRESAAARSPELWQKQATYKRQYAGLIRDGHRLIYASFFCNPFDEQWRHRVLVVMDGGDCFFQLIYDPERDSFSELMINGDA